MRKPQDSNISPKEIQEFLFQFVKRLQTAKIEKVQKLDGLFSQMKAAE